MSKIEDLQKDIAEIKTKTAVKEGRWALIRTICVTATGSFLTFCIWLGNVIYDKFDAVQAGIKAFLAALGQNK